MSSRQLLVTLDSRYPELPPPGVLDCQALATEYTVSPEAIRRALRTIREQRAIQALRVRHAG